MKVADFGAGQGSHMAALSASAGTTGRVYLLDVQKTLVDRLATLAARQGLGNVDPLWADLETPKSSGIADGALDRVLLSHVLFQVDDRAAVLAEAYRVLKPGGRALFVEWLPEAPAARLHGERVISSATLSAEVSSAGFLDATPVSVGSSQHSLTARKQ